MNRSAGAIPPAGFLRPLREEGVPTGRRGACRSPLMPETADHHPDADGPRSSDITGEFRPAIHRSRRSPGA